jgi:hypothetical protein
VILFESAIRTRILPDVGSGTLTLRYQLYAFCNLFAGHYPPAIRSIGGAGLVAPTFLAG